VKGDVEIVARFNVIDCPANYDLVFRSIQYGLRIGPGPGSSSVFTSMLSTAAPKLTSDLCLLALVRFLSARADHSSLVWLEKAQNGDNSRMDFRGQARDGFFKVRLLSAKGKKT